MSTGRDPKGSESFDELIPAAIGVDAPSLDPAQLESLRQAFVTGGSQALHAARGPAAEAATAVADLKDGLRHHQGWELR